MAESFALPSLAHDLGARRLQVVAAVAVAVVLCAGVAAVILRDGPRPIDEAARLLDHDDEFAAPDGASSALGRVSVLLRREGEACERDDGDACDAFFAASAYAQVVALNVQACTAPGIFDARTAVRRTVDDLRRDPSGARLPAVPRCG